MPEEASNPLSPYQQAREQALKTSASVLSASSALWSAKKPPTVIEGVDDLLKVADWILGDDRPIIAIPRGAFRITPENAPSLFEMLGRTLPDCGHEDCPIHAPAREAKDLDPDDAKSSFDPEPVGEWKDAGTTGVDPGDPTGFKSGEELSEAVTEELDRVILGNDNITPPVDLASVAPGQVFVHNNERWIATQGLGGTKYWARLPDEETAPATQTDDEDDEDDFDDL